MQPLELSLSDIISHVVTIGADVYPQIEICDERTRLNMFYEEARQKWPDLFKQLTASDNEFRISTTFQPASGSTLPTSGVNTFCLTNRGPIYTFPLVLPEPIGSTHLEDSFIETFHEIRELFVRAVGDRLTMRIGLVRDVIFGTGEVSCTNILARLDSFAGANLRGGNARLKFQDSKYNHDLLIEPGALERRIQLPVGATVKESAGYGVRVRLDVNNIDLQKPLNTSDISEVLERASGLWPEELLEFLRKLGQN